MDNSQTKSDPQALGERLKAARGEMPVAKLAELAGVSKAYIHQIENGECQRPSAQVLFSIATITGTSVAYLLGKGPNAPEPGVTQMPESLIEFSKTQSDIKQADLEMLARIKHRGRQPKTADDWKYLWESIKRMVR